MAEVNNAPGKAVGDEMSFQCLRVTKGFGRMSMILWAVLYSYKHLREKLEADLELSTDFRRRAFVGQKGRLSRIEI